MTSRTCHFFQSSPSWHIVVCLTSCRSVVRSNWLSAAISKGSFINQAIPRVPSPSYDSLEEDHIFKLKIRSVSTRRGRPIAQCCLTSCITGKLGPIYCGTFRDGYPSALPTSAVPHQRMKLVFFWAEFRRANIVIIF